MGEEGAAIQDYLASETGQRTVPSIWIKKNFIGGECVRCLGEEEVFSQRIKV